MNPAYTNGFFPYTYFPENNNSHLAQMESRIPLLNVCIKNPETTTSCRNLFCGYRYEGIPRPLYPSNSPITPPTPVSMTSSSDVPMFYHNTMKESASVSPNSAKLPKRPFKCFPNDSMAMALEAANAEALMTGGIKSSADAYAEFRNKMLSQIQNDSVSSTNKNMRRTHNSENRALNNTAEDSEYFEKRRKNNEAARKSREARKAKEDELAIRCAFLEQENIKLKFKLSELEKERMILQRLI